MMLGSVPTNTTKNYTTYMASIRLKSAEETQGFGYGYICDGVIISENLILTTTSCLLTSTDANATVRDVSEFLVVVGNIYRYNNDSSTLEFDVINLSTHDDFNSTSLENDIAILKLNASIPSNWATAQTIPLGTAEVPESTQCVVTSWQSQIGPTVQLKTQISLEYVNIKNNTGCFSSGTPVASLGNDLPGSMICAAAVDGEGLLSNCGGDSGAPLVCDDALIGIVSWGNGCNFVGPFPGVYTNVTYFNSWIQYTSLELNGGGIEVTTEHGDGATSVLSQSKYGVLVVMLLALFMRN
ncbi:trypsin alpha-3-like [Teleopsis dalmanni]|uniref:trypsin alpha-3-like n=1 Tax=Teleopsis dalmanni TaxID=139649 RepID=UPI0018CF1080|nr:trypsin alpha-3-like [Teleopsis dalmanni]